MIGTLIFARAILKDKAVMHSEKSMVITGEA